MRILVVSPFLPYTKAPHAGGVSVYRSIEKLSRNNDVTLLSRVDPSELEDVRDVEPLCSEVHLYPFSYKANILLKIFSYLVLGLKANRLLGKGSFDLLQVEFTEAGIGLGRQKMPSVLVAHDVITKPAQRRFDAAEGPVQRLAGLLRLKLTRSLERYISKKFDMVFVMSELDRDYLLGIDDTIKAVVSTNLLGLDFPPDAARAGREESSILFAGAMHRDLNVEAVLYFYEKVLPVVRKSIPGVRFYVVGNGPPGYLLELARKDPGLVVTGFVEEMEEYFLRAEVFVSPLLVGGGIIVKNLQAMAYALPVVTTTIGNEGIGAEPGRDLFVADEPGGFARKVVELLNDAGLRSRLGESARRFARERFSDEFLFEERMGLYRKLLKERPGEGGEGGEGRVA